MPYLTWIKPVATSREPRNLLDLFRICFFAFMPDIFLQRKPISKVLRTFGRKITAAAKMELFQIKN
jgi:hypothetical protein